MNASSASIPKLLMVRASLALPDNANAEKGAWGQAPNESPLYQNLKNLGCQLKSFSTVAIHGFDGEALSVTHSHFINSDIVIFTSRYAAFFACLYYPLSVAQTKKCIAVGESTAALLRKQGVLVECATPQNSAGVMALLEQSELSGKSILNCKGKSGLDVIANKSTRLGANVSHAEFYERRVSFNDSSPIVAYIKENISDIVTLGLSVEVLLALKENIDKENCSHLWLALCEKKLLVISQRISEAAMDMGFKNVLVANAGSGQSLAQLLVNLSIE